MDMHPAYILDKPLDMNTVYGDEAAGQTIGLLYQGRTGKLVSLFEMLEQLGVIAVLRGQINMLRPQLQSQPLDDPLLPHLRRQLSLLFVSWRGQFHRWGLKFSVNTIEQIIGPLQPDGGFSGNPEEFVPARMTGRQALSRLDQLDENFLKDTRLRMCWILTEEEERVYHLTFGDDVEKAFPSAMKEAREANTCYALGRHTACVFHMMRAAEHGLRALAGPMGTTTPNVPLEHLQWQQILEQVEMKKKALQIERWSQPAKTRALQFFSITLADFYAFKDAIRNITMHTKAGGTYNAQEAAGVRARVEECFKRLAPRVDEAGTKTLTEADFTV
jgi:hypothetical protein